MRSVADVLENPRITPEQWIRFCAPCPPSEHEFGDDGSCEKCRRTKPELLTDAHELIRIHGSN